MEWLLSRPVAAAGRSEFVSGTALAAWMKSKDSTQVGAVCAGAPVRAGPQVEVGRERMPLGSKLLAARAGRGEAGRRKHGKEVPKRLGQMAEHDEKCAPLAAPRNY